ncbi:hypothetical protein QFB08_003695 [Salmonella enterica]|nr:hypothetical protein [Salmonella enterica subsp. enterica]EKY7109955.1 hypothetical protein [Salmonella enterica]
MKKTVIALAVVASAAVSCSAMAWTGDGSGGSVEFGGTLTPEKMLTPWEVKVGSAVTDLDALIQKGQQVVDVTAKKAIPILGIRTMQKTAFKGRVGIDPKINYNNAVQFGNMRDGGAELILDILDAGDAKIGTLRTAILAGAGIVRDSYYFSAYDDGAAFEGGLGKAAGQVVNQPAALEAKLNSIDPEFTANIDKTNAGAVATWNAGSFDNETKHFSAYYGSGIEAGNIIKITLDTPAAGDAPIVWKASLPVTVSYQ